MKTSLDYLEIEVRGKTYHIKPGDTVKLKSANTAKFNDLLNRYGNAYDPKTGNMWALIEERDERYSKCPTGFPKMMWDMLGKEVLIKKISLNRNLHLYMQNAEGIEYKFVFCPNELDKNYIAKHFKPC